MSAKREQVRWLKSETLQAVDTVWDNDVTLLTETVIEDVDVRWSTKGRHSISTFRTFVPSIRTFVHFLSRVGTCPLSVSQGLLRTTQLASHSRISPGSVMLPHGSL